MLNFLKKNWNEFTELFNMQDDRAKGRTFFLMASLLSAFYGVFISGTFSTSFLTMYDMSISDTGVLTFTSYAANMLSIFSPMLLGRFSKKKRILLAAKIIYYVVCILLVTVAPLFFAEKAARLTCFILLQTFATGFFALFSPGFTLWVYQFYPEDQERRSRYFLFSMIISGVVGNLISLVSSSIVDALSNSPYKNEVILALRYAAFLLALVEVLIQSRAKEYPYVKEIETKISDIFIIPFQSKKFIACMILIFIWNYVSFLNNGLWFYHLMNHLDFSHTKINLTYVLYSPVMILCSSFWKKVLRRYSWIRTFAIAMLIYVPTEAIMFFMNKDNGYVYLPTTLVQHVANVAITLVASNILYMNLPTEKPMACVAFYTFGCNLFAFLGMMTGTLLSSISGDETMLFFGLEIYSVQLTIAMRFFALLVLGIFLLWKWKLFTSDEIIAEFEN